MKVTHTPGPWRYCPTNNGHMIAGAKPGYLAEVRDCGSGCVQTNARLIAASPELLEMLYIALPFIEDAKGDPAYKAGRVAQVEARIRSVILNAGGEL